MVTAQDARWIRCESDGKHVIARFGQSPAVPILRQIHEDLHAAVADACGWPVDLSDEEILARLVALNHDRAEDERRGTIRWLRPDFQNPSGQHNIPLPLREGPGEGSVTAKQKAKRAKKQKWPKALSEQAGAVHAALAAIPTGATADDIDKSFLAPNQTESTASKKSSKPSPPSTKPANSPATATSQCSRLAPREEKPLAEREEYTP